MSHFDYARQYLRNDTYLWFLFSIWWKKKTKNIIMIMIMIIIIVIIIIVSYIAAVLGWNPSHTFEVAHGHQKGAHLSIWRSWPWERFQLLVLQKIDWL